MLRRTVLVVLGILTALAFGITTFSSSQKTSGLALVAVIIFTTLSAVIDFRSSEKASNNWNWLFIAEGLMIIVGIYVFVERFN